MPDQPLRLDIVSDTICPWCWIGKRHLAAALPRLAAEGLAFAVTWRPFQLNPDMPAGGVDRHAYRTAKFGSWQRSQAMDAQVARAGAAAGLDFRFDRMARTPNTIASHVLLRLALDQAGPACQDQLAETLFTAYFNQGADIGDPATLAALGAAAGVDTAPLSDPAMQDAVRAEEATARRLDLNGVPSFILEGHPLFSGAQPVEVMVQALRQATRALNQAA